MLNHEEEKNTLPINVNSIKEETYIFMPIEEVRTTVSCFWELYSKRIENMLEIQSQE